MSEDYRACFVLSDTRIDPSSLAAHHQTFGLDFDVESVCIALKWDGQCVVDQVDNSRDWAAFADDMNRPDAHLMGNFVAEDFYLWLGFLSLPAGRYGLLEISRRNMSRMSTALYYSGSKLDPLQYVAGLFRCLGATSMAMGLEASYDEAMAFLRGELPRARVDECIRMAIQPPVSSEQILLSSSDAREVAVGDLKLLTTWLSGMAFYLP